MKTHTHTTGPWKVENWKYNESLILWRRDGVPTIVGGHDAIAEILNLYRPDDDATGESEAMANARLIASAPELFDALEKILVGLSPASVEMQRDNLPELCKVCREIAENALTKAKGVNA